MASIPRGNRARAAARGGGQKRNTHRTGRFLDRENGDYRLSFSYFLLLNLEVGEKLYREREREREKKIDRQTERERERERKR